MHPSPALTGEVLGQPPLHIGVKGDQAGGPLESRVGVEAAVIVQRLVDVGSGQRHQIGNRQLPGQGVRHAPAMVAVEGVQQLRRIRLYPGQQLLPGHAVHREYPHLTPQSFQIPLYAPHGHGIAVLSRVVVGCNHTDAHW